jgi:hypothetical protein
VLAGAATLSASAALVLFASYAAPRASAYAEAAPPGFSGGFGEQSCHACHFHAAVNAAPGRVTIAGVPDRFAPGRRYPLTATLSRPGMKLAGLQLTARFKDGGAQAGALAPDEGEQDRVRVDVQSGVQYFNQRRRGTSLTSSDTASWKLIWTAPASGGAVVFHVATNAADGDETVEGDYVHTAAVESAPGGTHGWRSASPLAGVREALSAGPRRIRSDFVRAAAAFSAEGAASRVCPRCDAPSSRLRAGR